MKVTSSPSISLFAANRLRGRTSICGLLFGKAIFHVRASSSLGRFVLAMTTPACSVRSLEDGDSGDKSSQNCKKLKGSYVVPFSHFVFGRNVTLMTGATDYLYVSRPPGVKMGAS
ncbi:Hypp7133 [Branchiostoma lanceolatum]|uniref:Hypp7133 protein n=1 Tax=Branchiostoma lanceolatum TaxID=7740 RepID=A0A8J9YXF9_BRALA|nr:Hypp7133 [Branchiostoma lanceolatum]